MNAAKTFKWIKILSDKKWYNVKWSWEDRLLDLNNFLGKDAIINQSHSAKKKITDSAKTYKWRKSIPNKR